GRARAGLCPADQPACRLAAPPAPQRSGPRGRGGGRDAADLSPARRRTRGGAPLPRVRLGRCCRTLSPFCREHEGANGVTDVEPITLAFEVDCAPERA